LYAPADFVVIETGTDERALIILGRPFLNTWGAIIYASAAKISFYIKGRKETFSFKNKTTQILEQSRHEPRKRTNRRNRNKQMWTESAKMVTIVQGGQDRRIKSPFLTKKDNPATYQLLFGTMPLKPTYTQLQMADQTFRKVEVIDIGEDEYNPPTILGRPFLSSVKSIIYIGTGEVHMHFLSEKVRRYFTDPNYIVEDSKQVRTEDDATAIREGKSSRTDG